MNNGLADYVKKNSGIILAVLICIEAIHLRIYFFREITGDFTDYVSPWIEFIREHGFWNAFQFKFSDYAPLYLHVLATLSLFIENNLFVVKATSWIFEIIAVIYVFRLLTHFDIGKQQKWILSALFLVLPTVLINSSYWGQSDIVYGSMVLASIYYLLKEKYFFSYLFLGIAFAFKLQSIFIFPLYFLAILMNKKTWKYALLVPAIYLVAALPSFFAGRSFYELMTIYVTQAQALVPLVFNTTTVYLLIDDREIYHDMLSMAGIWFTGILMLVLCVTLYLKNKEAGLSKDFIIVAALMFAIAVPYFLPHMHERYFFLADMLSFLFVVITRRYYFIPVIIIYSSLQCYLFYLKGFKMVAPSHLSFLYLLVLIFVVFLVYSHKPSIKKHTGQG